MDATDKDPHNAWTYHSRDISSVSPLFIHYTFRYKLIRKQLSLREVLKLCISIIIGETFP